MSEQAGWQEHAAFMNALVNAGFIVLGGPLGDGHALLLLVNAQNMEAVGEQFASDPWTAVGLLRITKIEPWDLLLGTP